MKKDTIFKGNFILVLALMAGLLCGYMPFPQLHSSADIVATLILNILKLISVPLLFLSVVANLAEMDGIKQFKTLGLRLIKYTVLTTVMAASVALCSFLIYRPVYTGALVANGAAPQFTKGGLTSVFINMVPSNIAQVVLDNHVVGIMFIAITLGIAILTLPDEHRKPVSALFSGLFAAMLRITEWIMYIIPLAIWAFATQFMHSAKTSGAEALSQFAIFAACILTANLIQGVVVLPSLLKLKGISPLKTFKAMSPAIAVGFLSSSSNAALPLSLECAKNNIGVDEKRAHFGFPLCATINMNACAAFILICFLFVAGSSGMHFSLFELLLWVIVASIAAIGNAGVPMGCYFMTTALVLAMGLPTTLMGMILPIYVFLDMFETGLNIWSDSSIVTIVDQTEKKGLFLRSTQ